MGTISHVKGDIFSAPAGSILVHACNTQGSWGSGIALAFREKYPAQYEKYRAHCKEHGQTLVGSCLLIPGDTHDIACLFTSQAYGRRKDSPDQIVAATRTAVQNLLDKNVKKRALHAWYDLPRLSDYRRTDELDLQPLQFGQICCSVARHRGCFERFKSHHDGLFNGLIHHTN